MKPVPFRLILPIDVSFNSDFAVNGDEMVGKITATTDITLSKSLQQVKLSGLTVDVDSTGSLLEGGKLKSSFKSDIDVDLAAQLVSSDKIAYTLNLAGDIAPVNPMEVSLESPMQMNLASMVMDLPAMQYSIPGSKGTGSLTLSNLDKSMPTVKLTLATDKFDATPWMTVATGNTSMNATAQPESIEELLLSIVSIHSASAAAKSEPVEIPSELIRQLDVDAGLTIGSFIMDTLQATDVKAQLNAKKGVVRIEPFSAKLFGGSSSGMLEVDARADMPKFSLKETAQGRADCPGDEIFDGTGCQRLDYRYRRHGHESHHARPGYRCDDASPEWYRQCKDQGRCIRRIQRTKNAAEGQCPAERTALCR